MNSEDLAAKWEQALVDRRPEALLRLVKLFDDADETQRRFVVIAPTPTKRRVPRPRVIRPIDA